MFGSVALLESSDVSLFPRRNLRFVGHGELQRGPRPSGIVRVHRLIDMRPEGVSHTPVCHRAVGGEIGGGAEGTDGFLMIEAEEQAQALIEVTLSLLRLRGDRMMQVAQPFKERARKIVGGKGA